MKLVGHIVFWVLIWVWMTTVYIYDDRDFLPFLAFNLTRLPAIIVATYTINHFVVYKRLAIPKPKYTESLALFLVIFLAATLVDRTVSGMDFFKPTLHGEPLDYYFINLFPLLKNAFILLSVICLAASVQFFLYTYQQQKEIHQLKEEKLESQLSFLRSQINPHFLFNTFNNLYSLASRNEQHELAQGLAGMAGLMRYLTYESNVPEVHLSKEVDLIQSFINLQKLRIPDEEEVIIDFKSEGDMAAHCIAPVLLLPLVENAFKFSFPGSDSAIISIFLSVSDDRLLFKVDNKVQHQLGSESAGGLGLENLRKRLEIIYPGRHNLSLQNIEGYFSATLNLNLGSRLVKETR